jgi:hypothetical protein
VDNQRNSSTSFEAQDPFPLTPDEVTELRAMLAERRATAEMMAQIMGIGSSAGHMTKMVDPYEAGRKARALERAPECVAAWPECRSGGYDPRCCRFPKSCSCSVIPQVSSEDEL